MIEILKELIAIESISCNEEKIAGYIETLLKKQSGHTSRFGNNIVWKNDWEEGKSAIALGAHLDTVPFTASDWQVTQPCQPLEKDGKIYGRGSCDMKAGAAIILDLIMKKDIGNRFNILCFFYEKEELGFPNGVTTLMEAGLFKNIDLCIIPEPTECKINYGVFSNLYAKLTSKGVAVHSSKPKTGVNALYELLPVIDKIRSLPLKMIDGVEEAISVNKISGGNAINILPDKVEAFVDFRFDPNLTKKDVEKIFHSFETENVKAEIQGIYPGIINDLKENQLLSELMDFVDESSIAPFWSDIGQVGQAGIPSVNYGPGSIDMAHRIDEYVPIVDMHKVRTVIKAFLS